MMMMTEPSRKKTVIYTGRCIKCKDLLSYYEGTVWLECLFCRARFETKYIQDPSIEVRYEEMEVSGISLDAEEIEQVKEWLAQNPGTKYVTPGDIEKKIDTSTKEIKQDIGSLSNSIEELKAEILKWTPPSPPENRPMESQPADFSQPPPADQQPHLPSQGTPTKKTWKDKLFGKPAAQSLDIADIVLTEEHIIRLYSDGSISVEGTDAESQFDHAEWKNVKQIAAASKGFMGVTSDGRVILSKSLQEKYASKIQNWTDICAVAFDGDAMIALTKEGNVQMEFSKSKKENNKDERASLASFNLTAIAATPTLTIGIDKEGMVKPFYKKKRKSDTNKWSGVCAVAISGENDVIALKQDGGVESLNFQGKDALNVSTWHDIVQVAAGTDFVVGLTKSGNVLSAARNSHSKPDTSTWQKVTRIAACNGVVIGITRTGDMLQTGKFH